LLTDIAASDGAVKPVQFHLSFQSRVGPVQWLRPYTDDMIRQLGEEEKVRRVACLKRCL
jgi:protoheme ferro-lyase